MIAACPKCAARYRIEREKIGEGGVRLRCSRCESVFRVRAPAAQTPAEEAPAKQATRPAASGSAPPPSAAVASAAPPPSTVAPASKPAAPQGGASRGEKEREVVVLVAMPDAELAKTIADEISAAGAAAAAVFDGVDAMLEIQRKQPKAVLLAADLPKMFGFQVCEIVKRNASLRDTRVVLAGAVHHPDRYRRSPSELYGADAYVEVPDLPEGLLPILRGFGLIEAIPTQPGRRDASMDFEETRIDGPAPAGMDRSPGGDPPMSGMDDLSVARSGSSRPDPAGGPTGAGAPAGLPPLGSVPLQEAFEPVEPAPQAASTAVRADADSSPSLELDLDWAGSEAAQPQVPRSPARPAAPQPAPARESGGGVPISLDFDFGEDEVAAAPPSPEPAAPKREAAPPTPAPPSPELAEERAQAERLARIIVSDIVLYNEEKFAAAVQAGTVAAALSAELDEGRGLFTQRVDERVRREADFLLEELLRVARSRGMD